MRTADLVWHAVSLDLINLQSRGTKHKQRRLVGWFNSGAEAARKFRGAISIIFGSQVSLRVHYYKRDEVYFTTLLWQNNGRQNGLISRMLFSELCKIMAKRATFVGFRGQISPIAPLWIRSWLNHVPFTSADRVFEKSLFPLQIISQEKNFVRSVFHECVSFNAFLPCHFVNLSSSQRGILSKKVRFQRWTMSDSPVGETVFKLKHQHSSRTVARKFSIGGYSVACFNLGALEFCLEGLRAPKPAWRTGVHSSPCLWPKYLAWHMRTNKWIWWLETNELLTWAGFSNCRNKNAKEKNCIGQVWHALCQAFPKTVSHLGGSSKILKRKISDSLPN